MDKNFVRDQIEIPSPANGSSPEIKLLSAVVALAIKDICEKPNKKSKNQIMISSHSASAFNFLFSDRSTWMLDALDIDAEAFRERLYSLMRSSSDSRWRNARINFQNYRKNLIFSEGSKL